MSKPRVLLADDHEILLAGLVKLLEPRCEIVAQVGAARELLEAAERLQPDVVVLDVSLQDLNGLDAIRPLGQAAPDARVVILTMHESAALALEALRRGAAGYVVKRSAPAELFAAIRTVRLGAAYVTRLLRDDVAELARSGAAPRPALTERQRDVVRLLAEGRPMKQVAAILGLTQRTVAYHKYHLMREIGLRSTADLVRFAVQQGLVGAPAAAPPGDAPPATAPPTGA